MDKFTQFIKKWWPTAIPVIIGAWHEIGPQVNAWVSAHPKYAIWFAVAYSILAHLKDSPIVPSQGEQK